LDRRCTGFALHELADVAAMKIDDATMVPDRQHLVLHDGAHFGPTPERLLLVGAIEIVERLHGLIVVRLLSLLVAGRIGTVEDAPAMLRRDLPRLFQEHVRIAPSSVTSATTKPGRNGVRYFRFL
jgi:hypothetical protein